LFITESNSAAAIAGGVVGALVAMAIIAGVVFYFKFYKKNGTW
jgi:Flp pilus assembly pilin Flp